MRDWRLLPKAYWVQSMRGTTWPTFFITTNHHVHKILFSSLSYLFFETFLSNLILRSFCLNNLKYFSSVNVDSYPRIFVTSQCAIWAYTSSFFYNCEIHLVPLSRIRFTESFFIHDVPLTSFIILWLLHINVLKFK